MRQRGVRGDACQYGEWRGGIVKVDPVNGYGLKTRRVMLTVILATVSLPHLIAASSFAYRFSMFIANVVLCALLIKLLWYGEVTAVVTASFFFKTA